MSLKVFDIDPTLKSVGDLIWERVKGFRREEVFFVSHANLRTRPRHAPNSPSTSWGALGIVCYKRDTNMQYFCNEERASLDDSPVGP